MPLDLPPDLPTTRRRNRAIFEWLNRLKGEVRKLDPSHSRTIRRNQTAIGTFWDADEVPPQEGGSSVKQFKITGFADDHLICQTWDGTNLGGVDTFIAKVPRLRKTPFHNQTLSYNFNGTVYAVRYTYSAATYRQATITNVTPQSIELQGIVPIFQQGSLIYATEPEGGTDLVVAGVPVTWLDLNVDARAWARY